MDKCQDRVTHIYGTERRFFQQKLSGWRFRQAPYWPLIFPVGIFGGMPIKRPSARINSMELLAPKPTRAKHTPWRPQSLGGRTTSGSLPKTRFTCSRARRCSVPSALGLKSWTLRVMPSKKDSKKIVSSCLEQMDNPPTIHPRGRAVYK
jgi:hypothetical protein